MNKILLEDRFKTPSATWAINEDVPGDGPPSYNTELYCARLQGPMALYGGKSLNQRYYGEDLWDSTLSATEFPLFGTIGHDQEMHEGALTEGLITHKITKVWPNKQNGTIDGEILILKNPVGEILANYLRAGMKISVSSRAYGNFKGKTADGYDIVDPDGFELHGWDWVLSPGVLKAQMNLMESVQQPPKKEHHRMEGTKELFESLSINAKLSNELNESVKKATEAQSQLNESVRANTELKKSLNEAAKRYNFIKTALRTNSPVQTVKEISEGIGKWLVVPEFQDIAREFGMFDTQGATMGETVKKLVEGLNTYSKRGTVKKIDEAFALLESYKALGTPAEIQESKKLVADFQECGSTPAKIHEALDLLDKYTTLAPDASKLEESLKVAQKAEVEYNSAKRLIAARKIAEGLKLYAPTEGKTKEQIKANRTSVDENITKMLCKMPTKQVVETLRSFKGKRSAVAVTESVQTPAKVATKKVAPAAGKGAQSAAQLNESASAERGMSIVKMMEYKPIETPRIQ